MVMQHIVLNSLTAQMDENNLVQIETTEIFGGILDGNGQRWLVRKESA